mgnify:CR=1 FL=1
MHTQIGRYSKYIRPISLFFDLLVISILCPLFFDKLNLDFKIYLVYQFIIWIVIAFFIQFYNIYRFTTPVEIASKIAKQFILFSLLIIAFFRS